MFDEQTTRETGTAPPPPPRLTLVPRRTGLASTPTDTGSAPSVSTPPRPATVGARVGAFIIDCLLVNIVLAFVGAASGLLPISAEGLGTTQAYVVSVVSATVTLAYFVAAEAAFGRTLGKRLLRCAVVMVDGRALTVRAAFTRRVLFFAGLLIPLLGPLLAFATPLAALVTTIQDGPAGRGFHDHVADTWVVQP